jgi:hypothetical protein
MPQRAAMSLDRTAGNSDRVSVRVAQVGDAFTPSHIGRFSENGRARRVQLAHGAVDVVDIDEHLKADTLADMQAVLLFGPFGRDNRDLKSAPAKSDISGFAFRWELEVTLESERLVERRRTRDLGSKDDREGALSDRKSIGREMSQCSVMSLELSLRALGTHKAVSHRNFAHTRESAVKPSRRRILNLRPTGYAPGCGSYNDGAPTVTLARPAAGTIYCTA